MITFGRFSVCLAEIERDKRKQEQGPITAQEPTKGESGLTETCTSFPQNPEMERVCGCGAKRKRGSLRDS